MAEVPVSSSALGAAVKMVVRTFLEPQHYQKLHRTLSDRWSSLSPSLTAVTKMMEQHGVRINPQEEARLAAMGEEAMVNELVRRMPKQSREQFEHFFLQLQLVVSTTQRLTQALDQGQARAMEEVLDSADDVGITPYILKMAIVQAGAEVKQLEQRQDQWINAAERKMAPLLRGQEDAMEAQLLLAQAKAELDHQRGEGKDKSKKVLLGMAAGQDAAKVSTTFSMWSDYVKRMKVENEIRKEYEERIFFAEDRLIDYREKQIANVKSVLMRKAAQGDADLVSLCFETFKEDVAEKKRDAENAHKVKELEGRLSSFAEAQAANTKKVMARMNAGNDAAVMGMHFQAWVQFLEEYRKNKEYEDMLKQAEAKTKAFMDKQNEGAKSVLDRMAGASETGLLASVIQGWAKAIQEDKKAAEMEAILAGADGRFKSFADRNSQSAGGVMNRAAELQDLSLLMTIWNNWKVFAKVEKTRRFQRVRNDMRSQQIMGVKSLFKNFAHELETIKDKDATPRQEAPPA